MHRAMLQKDCVEDTRNQLVDEAKKATGLPARLCFLDLGNEKQAPHSRQMMRSLVVHDAKLLAECCASLSISKLTWQIPQ